VEIKGKPMGSGSKAEIVKQELTQAKIMV